MRKTFARRRYGNRGAKPALTWSDISTTFLVAAATGTTQVIQISLESPVNLASLGSDPPEDMTILRVVGDFTTILSTSGRWRLALLVQDRTWTANTSGVDDNDKRVLWSSMYENTTGAPMGFFPPGYSTVGLSPLISHGVPREAVHVDITPKVRIEPGKALYLVAYEEVNGAMLSVTSSNMRVLYKRSGRR